jgi:hypothetical protein
MQVPEKEIKVNPKMQTEVSGGTWIWLIAKKRPQAIEWQNL